MAHIDHITVRSSKRSDRMTISMSFYASRREERFGEKAVVKTVLKIRVWN